MKFIIFRKNALNQIVWLIKLSNCQRRGSAISSLHASITKTLTTKNHVSAKVCCKASTVSTQLIQN